ncbi:23S rRNA methyltransferase [Wigglesworthia glossinidia endosymbiont of Glossina morsitans morsitans (Yale colony)]|uniref:Dual-specificity RNA methyltransferase RlmN n=1 Tax=Wigglesworthia glossinidia endosymbiont of Glossina morsitans morsitans (Yale colony) TaxID=1142511 RepID=H6Q4G5_WIGGL|nr:23S rRNA (adenine(2503)-C(2))-methyltransferase RlmN [Wigglesworthia glossinidia]AFA41025.1 23S rRNA methyltransferase [Wigglesworthia glossinidia endosymbiont of Glossina morsitans morsitans (Yale colony)]
MNKKINLFGMTKLQLQEFFLNLGEKKFRANQFMQAVYQNYCDNINNIFNFNKNLRNKLLIQSEIKIPKIISEYISQDGTIKWILQISNQNIEIVYIPEKNRATLCISCQIGCALNCTFCATAMQGFNRNLDSSEMIGQIWNAMKIVHTKNYTLKKITNIVFMGMGEPLLNLKQLISTINIILDNHGFNLSKRRITISTAGISHIIQNLGKVLDVKLAISLHAPNDILRNQIMPINRKYNICSLLSAAKKYISVSKANQGKISIEYVMLNKVNDSDNHAYQLKNCLKNFPCKVNLIPWNCIPKSQYKPSNKNQIKKFSQILKKNGIITTIRKQRGDSINAACGQLSGIVANRMYKRTNMLHKMP